MSDLLFWVFILFACSAVSSALLTRAKFQFFSAPEELVFSCGLGLGLAAYMVFALGSFGVLTAPAVLGVLLLCALSGGSRVLYLSVCLCETFKSRLREKKDPVVAALLVLLVMVAAFSLFGALAPATGQDELSYHLVHPKLFAENHRVYEIPYSTPALWPYLGEMLFTLGLLLKGAGLAKLSHWTFYLLTGAAIYCFVSRFENRKTAFFSGAVYLFMPAAFIQAAFGYVDNTLAFYVFMAYYVLYLFFISSQRQWAVLSGVFTGLALSVKFLALFMLPVTAGFFLVHFFRQKDKRGVFLSFLSYVTFVVLFGGLWYLRSYLLRGNPVFPFFYQFFGGPGERMAIDASAHGMGRGLAGFLLLPWNLTFHPQHFGGEHIGVLFLFFLPVFLLSRPMPRHLTFMAAAAASYAFFCFFMDQNTRFLFPAFALLAVAAGPSLAALVAGGPRIWEKASALLVTGVFAMQAFFSVYHFHDEALVFFGRLSARNYLLGLERTFALAEEVNRQTFPSDKILSIGEVRGYYFQSPFVIESELDSFTGYSINHSPQEIRDFLKSHGFTHVLVAENSPREKALEGVPMQSALIIRNLGHRYVLYRIL